MWPHMYFQEQPVDPAHREFPTFPSHFFLLLEPSSGLTQNTAVLAQCPRVCRAPVPLTSEETGTEGEGEKPRECHPSLSHTGLSSSTDPPVPVGVRIQITNMLAFSALDLRAFWGVGSCRGHPGLSDGAPSNVMPCDSGCWGHMSVDCRGWCGGGSGTFLPAEGLAHDGW